MWCLGLIFSLLPDESAALEEYELASGLSATESKDQNGKNLAPIGARLAEERQRTSIPPGLSTNLSPVLLSQECCFEDEHLILGMTAPNKRVASRNRLAVGQRVHPMLFPFSIVL